MWLSIDDTYECSIEGQIRNKKTARILKPWIASGGYLYCRRGGAGSIKSSIHRLVAELFLPQPTEGNLEIDHIDRNKKNNHASNLRWVSHTINMGNINMETKARPNNRLNELGITMSGKKYRVQIRGVYHGLFETIEEAKKVRDHMIKQCLLKSHE